MSSTNTIQFQGKPLTLKLTPDAQRELQQRTTPLHVEMELYFSCMIRKKVRFYDETVTSVFKAALDKIELGFRPVMTQQCSLHDSNGPPPVTDFPIKKAESFIPQWLRLDFHKGEWRGEFGYE